MKKVLFTMLAAAIAVTAFLAIHTSQSQKNMNNDTTAATTSAAEPTVAVADQGTGGQVETVWFYVEPVVK